MRLPHEDFDHPPVSCRRDALTALLAATLSVVASPGCGRPDGPRAGQPCKTMNDCGPHEACYEGVCRTSCVTDSYCDESKEHCEQGVCLPRTALDCGNGRVQSGEECDDGNRGDGDGCSSQCVVEAGWTCVGSSSICTRLCGNGTIEAGEQCDDANTTALDGCSDCTVERGWECTGATSVCVTRCGDGLIAGTEECDDGGPADEDGCSSGCVIEPACMCSGEPTFCECAPKSTTLELALGIKELHWSWAAASRADYYRLWEDPDGVSGYRQVGGDLTTTEYRMEIAVYRHDWAQARYKVMACNAVGCIDSNEVRTDGLALNTVGYFKASNTEAGDFFGAALALSADGNTLAVGATGEDSAVSGINKDQANNSASNSGAVYIFTRTGGTWTQQAYVKASNTNTDDLFGFALALSADGNTLAVGAEREDSSATGIGGAQADNSAPYAGAVYMFTRTDGTWTQQAYIKASNTEAEDRFGSVLTLSADGNILAVGATGEDSNATGVNNNQADNSAPSAGAVYVFTRTGGTWAQEAYVKASNTGASDGFGGALALSDDGNTLAVGATGEGSNATGVNNNQADNSAINAGAVYVFTRTSGAWGQQAYIKASNTEAGDWFGGALALSDGGDTLAVGAVSEDSSATGINNNQADNSATHAGAVYVFTRTSGTWGQQAYIKASNTEAVDFFGRALGLSADGNTLAVGAQLEDSTAVGIDGDQTDNVATDAGAVYVFARMNDTWTQRAYVKASNTGAGDEFGMSLGSSADGNTLAVGARLEDSAAVGIGGNQTDDCGSAGPINCAADSGAVYLY